LVGEGVTEILERRLPRFEREAPRPAERRAVIARGVLIAHEQADLQRVTQTNARQLGA